MIRTIYLLAFFLLGNSQIQAQSIKAFKEYQANASAYENIKVIPVHSDEEASSFIIFVKEGVKLHKHVEHTEHVSVLAGKGEMTLGDETKIVKKGDFIVIPKGVPHSVKVLSKKPMKVLSVQSPKFEGKDRVFLESRE